MRQLDDLPPEEQTRILKTRLKRAEKALSDAETALEARMHELHEANQELSLRESKLAQRLDIESRQLLSALSTTDMATIYGERGKEFVASAGSTNLLGIPKGEPADLLKLMGALHPLDRDRIMRVGFGFFSDLPPGQDHRFHHRIIRYDTGETRWLSWVLRRESSTPTEPSKVYGTVRDITIARANARSVKALQLRAERRVKELNRLSEQLNIAQQKTAASLAARTRFLTEMAHGIRTPLNSLSGGLELLGDSIGEGSKDFKVVREAADQLLELASQLIEQADRDDDAPDPPPVAMEPVVEAKALDEVPRVLLAEDTESNRYVLERMLVSLGCETVVVGNGVEALEKIRQQAFDLVLMDVMMPLMDGEQATQAIRALSGPKSRTPIIGVTAHSLQAERERLLAAGMTVCLAKPIRREELETALRTALIGREAVQPLNARFDHELYQRAFFDLPEAYRERMRDAAKKDISELGEAVLRAAKGNDSEEMSRVAHSLKGVSLNVGAIGIVEELSRYREKLEQDPSFSSAALRREIASSLLAFDDLYDALVAKA